MHQLDVNVDVGVKFNEVDVFFKQKFESEICFNIGVDLLKAHNAWVRHLWQRIFLVMLSLILRSFISDTDVFIVSDCIVP